MVDYSTEMAGYCPTCERDVAMREVNMELSGLGEHSQCGTRIEERNPIV